MKKLKWLKLVSFALLLVVLVACGSDSTEGNDSEDGTKSGEDSGRPFEGETVTIGIWWGNDAEEATLKELIEAFTEETGIIVEPRTYTDYQVQLQTELAGGTAPDVFYVEAMLAPTFIEQGVIENLDNFIADTNGFNVNDFFTPALDAFSADGAVYGLPKDLSTLGLIYNERLLEDAGFTGEDIPTVMSELPAFLRELDAALPDDVVAGLTSSELSRHLFALQTSETDVIDVDGNVSFTEEGQLDYLEMLVDLYEDGIVQRAADLGHGWSGDAFGLEDAAIMIEGNWVFGHLEANFADVEFGTIELPTMNGENGSMMFTVAWGMNAASDNQGAAWEFINFVTGEEGMTLWADGAIQIPSRASSAQALDLDSNDILAPFVAAADYATPWQSGTALPIVMDEYNNFIVAALSGEMTLAEAMQEAQRVANDRVETHMQ